MASFFPAAVTTYASDSDASDAEADEDRHPRRRRAQKAFASAAGVGDENARRGAILKKRRHDALRVTGPLVERRDAQAHEIETEVEMEAKVVLEAQLPSPHRKWVRLVKADIEEPIAIVDRKPQVVLQAPKPRIVKFNWSQPKPSPIVPTLPVALITSTSFTPVSSVAASRPSTTTGLKKTPLVAPIALPSSSSPRVVSLSSSGPALVTPTSSSSSHCTPRRAARQWRSDDDLEESDSGESDCEGDLA